MHDFPALLVFNLSKIFLSTLELVNFCYEVLKKLFAHCQFKTTIEAMMIWGYYPVLHSDVSFV